MTLRQRCELSWHLDKHEVGHGLEVERGCSLMFMHPKALGESSLGRDKQGDMRCGIAHLCEYLQD